ncbi:MAG: beta/gamma crystallin-related protein, partial [Brevundimonas sp.]
RQARGGGGGWGGGGGVPGGRNTITVFRDANYTGGSETLRGEIPNLSRLGLNDAISSMRVNGRWEACTDANFSGQCEVFDGDVRNLSSYPGFNDRISSLRPLRGRW